MDWWRSPWGAPVSWVTERRIEKPSHPPFLPRMEDKFPILHTHKSLLPIRPPPFPLFDTLEPSLPISESPIHRNPYFQSGVPPALILPLPGPTSSQHFSKPNQDLQIKERDRDKTRSVSRLWVHLHQTGESGDGPPHWRGPE